MEDLVQNKLSDLDDIATNLEFGDDDEPDNSKRKLVENLNGVKKRKLDIVTEISESDDEPSTQAIADQLDSETSNSDMESEYEY